MTARPAGTPALYETAVARHLRELAAHWQLHPEDDPIVCLQFRARKLERGGEIDLLVRGPEYDLAVEVKSKGSANHDPSPSLFALARRARQIDGRAVRACVVYGGTHRLDGRIPSIPIAELLCALSQEAEVDRAVHALTVEIPDA